MVQFGAATSGEAVVEVFDLRGQFVAEIFRGVPPVENHRVTWDARGMSSGVYFVRVSQAGARETRKVTLLK